MVNKIYDGQLKTKEYLGESRAIKPVVLKDKYNEIFFALSNENDRPIKMSEPLGSTKNDELLALRVAKLVEETPVINKGDFQRFFGFLSDDQPDMDSYNGTLARNFSPKNGLSRLWNFLTFQDPAQVLRDRMFKTAENLYQDIHGPKQEQPKPASGSGVFPAPAPV